MPDIFDPLHCVAVNATAFLDPAVEVEGSNVHAYRYDRDRKHLKCSEGVAPYEFIVQRLPASAKAFLERGDLSDGERYQLAFLAACHRIERAGQVILEVPPSALKKSAHGLLLAPASWIEEVASHMIDDELGFGMDTVEEMGRVAYSTTRIAPRARGPFWLRVSDATRR